jgi:hypothetical protein
VFDELEGRYATRRISLLSEGVDATHAERNHQRLGNDREVDCRQPQGAGGPVRCPRRVGGTKARATNVPREHLRARRTRAGWHASETCDPSSGRRLRPR